MRFAYADPPYLGQSKKHYGRHADYAGEVDHAELIKRMCGEYDGWALSLSMKSLHYILGLCPPDVMVLAWFKMNAPPMGDGRMYCWEPVILRGGRNPPIPTTTALVAVPPPGYTFRTRPTDHVIGEKPQRFSLWLFHSAGLQPSDEFVDLFPGSGAVGRAWEAFTSQKTLGDGCDNTTPPTNDPFDGITDDRTALIRDIWAVRQEGDWAE